MYLWRIAFALAGLLQAGAAAASPASAQGGGGSASFFTLGQSERGAAVFERACRDCHSLDPQDAWPVGVAGARFLKRWHSVAGLYHKIRWTMPADRVLGLEVEDSLAVTAYLLHASGFAPGGAPLREDEQRLKKLVLKQSPAASDTKSPELDAGDGFHAGARGGFYSAAQARRGRMYFEGSCATCHVAEPEALAHADAERGVRMGGELVLMPLMGEGLLDYGYTSVGDLFLKTRTTMPIEYPNALSEQGYLDIVAYLLQVKGYPAGDEELVADLDAMRGMTLVEHGFERLFNGSDFTGLRFLLGHGCTPYPTGCGATEPGTTFRIAANAIHVSGRPSGYLYTEKTFLDFTLRFDIRWIPDSSAQPGSDYYANTGVLLFIREHGVWPKSLEIQGMRPSALSVLPIDTHPVFTTDQATRDEALRPLGEWNAVEIASKSGQVQASLNGRLVTTVTTHEFDEPGHIGFQSEGARVALRNIRIREE